MTSPFPLQLRRGHLINQYSVFEAAIYLAFLSNNDRLFGLFPLFFFPTTTLPRRLLPLLPTHVLPFWFYVLLYGLLEIWRVCLCGALTRWTVGG